MPQSSDKRRALMAKWFGDPIDDSAPYAFLLSRGYTEDKGIFYPPTFSHSINDEEHQCLAFMIEEWDYDFRQR